MRAILTYHSIDDSGSPISVSRQSFARHMEFLSDADLDVVPLAALVRTRSPKRDAVALTFDDGFANFMDEAVPHLRAHDFPSTVFVVTGHVGGTNSWGGSVVQGIPNLPTDGLGRTR